MPKNNTGEPLVAFRLTEENKEKLDKLLISIDCTYGKNPSVGKLIKDILKGDILLVKTK